MSAKETARGSLESQDSAASRSSDEPADEALAHALASGADSELLDDADLPTAVHVTNLPLDVFEDERVKAEFEDTFSAFDDEAWFQYFPSFRRARVNYSSAKAASKARVHLHETTVAGAVIKCYFVQVQSSRDESDDGTLHPPLPDKQFLISPPASPPVGWEPIREAEPTVNYDLLAAVAQMAPGEAHELHAGREEHPSIVVHVAEETEADRQDGQPRMRITQTRCPSR